MVGTETLFEDEYLLVFGKERLDEVAGYADPAIHEHYVDNVTVRISGRSGRRSASMECVCGNRHRLQASCERMTYAQMISLTILEGHCPGSARMAHMHMAVPNDCARLELDPTAS